LVNTQETSLTLSDCGVWTNGIAYCYSSGTQPGSTTWMVDNPDIADIPGPGTMTLEMWCGMASLQCHLVMLASTQVVCN
jgi:hypothetical protein